MSRGTKVLTRVVRQVGGSGTNKGLFLGPSLSGKPSAAPGPCLERGRAYLVPEVFHFSVQRTDQQRRQLNKMMKIRVRNDGGVLTEYNRNKVMKPRQINRQYMNPSVVNFGGKKFPD